MRKVETVISEPMDGDKGVTVKQYQLFTEDDDLWDEYFDVYVDGELRHERCDQLAVIRALSVYVNSLMFRM